MIDRDDSAPRVDEVLDERSQTGRAGDVTVPLITGTSDGKGWKLGGPLGLLIDLIRGK